MTLISKTIEKIRKSFTAHAHRRQFEQLNDFIVAGKTQEVERILEKRPDVVNDMRWANKHHLKPGKGLFQKSSPLISVLMFERPFTEDDLKIVQLLLQHGADPLAPANHNPYSFHIRIVDY